MPKPRKTIFADPYIGIIRGLIARRRAAGLTQWDVAHAFGTDQSYISRIERCQRRLDVHEYAILCGILRLDPGTLLRSISARAKKGLAK
jgi:transcriptional regulator with XRE-family HTH domain